MPVPTTIDDLSTTAASNSPAGSDTPADGDNFIRALSAFVASLRDKLNGTSSTGTLTTPVFAGSPTGTVTSGPYTPTLTNFANIAASTAWQSQYLRVGNVVTFSGYATGVQPSTTGGCVLRVSLPIASDFSGGGYLASGVGETQYHGGATIVANSSNSINITFTAVSTTAGLVTWHVTYTIV